MCVLRNGLRVPRIFSFFSDKVPGLFFFLGGMPAGMSEKEAYPPPYPDFYIDDSKLDVGIKAFVELVIAYGGTAG